METPASMCNESTISTTDTSDPALSSDDVYSTEKYMNSNFADKSSSNTEVFEETRDHRAAPRKLSYFRRLGLYDEEEEENEETRSFNLERSLKDMGYDPNEVEGWDEVMQARKESLYKLLKRMIENYIKPNVQIRIAEVTFNCHMYVLQCYSDFFMECGNEVLIQLPEEKVTSRAFVRVYEWMLAKKPFLRREGILELFNAANFLGIKDLVNQCWSCLDDDVYFCEDTAFMLYLEARDCGLESLQHPMLSRICKFFLTIVACEEFLYLNANEVCILLSSNTIGVNAEIEIFMSAVRWLNKDWTEREPFLLEIISCVRFCLMPAWLLLTIRNTECNLIKRIVNHPEVTMMVNDGISFTTTQMYYGEEREEFLYFLEYNQMEQPVQRQWIFDKECSYHPRFHSMSTYTVTYMSFLQYLHKIKSMGRKYWQNLEIVEDNNVQIFGRSSFYKADDSNSTSCNTKKANRDQGVQVESDVKHYEQQEREEGGEDRTADRNVHIASKVDLTELNRNQLPSVKRKTALSESSYSLQKAGDFDQCPHLPPTQYYVNEEKRLSYPKSVFLQESCGIHEPICDANNRLRRVQFSTDTVCVKPESGGVDDGIKIFASNEPMQGCRKKCQPAGKSATSRTSQSNAQEGNRPDEAAEKVNPTHQPIFKEFQQSGNVTLSAETLNAPQLGTRKILIFGGNDPYDQLEPHDEGRSLQKQKGILMYRRRSGGDVGHRDHCSHSKGGDYVLCYDTSALKWKHISYLPDGARYHHVAVACNGMIYVIGGTRANSHCTRKFTFEESVWSFDVQTLKWTQECNLPECRRDFAVVAVDDEANNSARKKGVTGFYVIGGENSYGSPMKTVWFYDVLHKNWTKKASLNIARYGSSAVVVNNTIIVGGGIVGETEFWPDDGFVKSLPITDTVEYYNLSPTHCVGEDAGASSLEKPRWVLSRTSLRIPRLFGKACVTANGEIFIVGGIGPNASNVYTSLSDVDVFDRHTGKWELCGNIKYTRHGHDVALVDDEIIIVGGVSAELECSLRSVENYCTKLPRSVTDFTELPWPLSGCAVVMLEG